MNDTDQHSRRQFLGVAGTAVAVAGATSLLPPSIARALSIPAYSRAGTIDDVGHVVILMQENRSFDHYFGTLDGVRGFGDRFTVPLQDGRTIWQQSNGTRIVQPYHLDSTAGNAQRVDGTPHSWRDAHDAWDGGRMSAWPEVKHDWSMGYYERAELPFQFALAEAFTLCDAYHCSIQAGTNPNRLFLWTGTNGPTGADVAAVVNEWDSLGESTVGYTWTTYPERLEQAGVSWKVYQSMPDNFGDNSLAGFVNYRRANAAMGNGPDGSPFIEYDEKFEDVDPLIKGIANTMPDGGFLEAFRSDVAAGRLPQVSWIVAPETYCEHPDPSSPIQGAYYTSAVLDALTASPDVWARTVLLANYDENDGFFDHVPPPAAHALGTNGEETGDATCDVAAEWFTHANPPGTTEQPPPDGGVYGMGPRVPMIVVSPWSRGGWVDSQVFDHTSVLQFLERRFGVREPNISPWRRAVAGDLTSAFDFARPDRQPPSSLSAPSKDVADWVRAAQEQLAQVAVPPAFEQAVPVQATGRRPSRALPYELQADAVIEGGSGGVQLTFTNAGDVGAVFHVYDQLHRDRIPRRYTVEAGRSLVGAWDTTGDGGRYDLWVIGPNGFHRTFAGGIEWDGDAPVADPAIMPEVAAEHAPGSRRLVLTLANRGSDRCTFTIAPNAYRPDGPRTKILAGGVEATDRWDVGGEGGWYDLTVTVDEAPAFLRRFAGRLENGEPGTSDPAMGVVPAPA